MNTIKEAYEFIKMELASVSQETEIGTFFDLICENLWAIPYMQWKANKEKEISNAEVDRFKKIVSELKINKPVQYILGETEFYELIFRVNEDVLIPRSETEELVHLIIDENKNKAISILDIGTGSGCIPVSLAVNMPNAKLSSCDVSLGAIELARENAKLNKCELNIFEYDILAFAENDLDKTYDVIVSNPPYIRNSEKELMHNNVLDNEPHLALFVEDSDPLLFYRTIAKFGLQYLNRPGKIYFEINEAFGKETAQIMESLGYSAIQVIEDLHGRDRIVSAKLF